MLNDMNKFKVELNRSGVRELLRSGDMAKMLEEEAERIRDRCGNGYATSSHVGKNRANASVYTDDIRAMRDNHDHNTLEKSMR